MYDTDQALMDRLQGRKTPLNRVANAVSRFGTILATGKPPADNGAERLANQMAYAQFKNSLPSNKAPQEYFTIDENGNPVPVEGMAGRKPLPVGYTSNYQHAAESRGELSDKKIPLVEAQTKQFGLGNQILEGIQSGQQSGDITPGTTFTGGGVTVPLNPKLDTDQASAVSSLQTFKPQIEEIAKATKNGIFNSMKPGVIGNIERTSRQYAVDSGIPMLTSADPKLQEVQGYLNSVRRYAFGEGGKNLTGVEKGIVDKLLNTTGKNDDQIISDHQKAIQIIQSKSNIALGGRNAAIGTQENVQIPEFPNEEALNAANLPKGTKVKVAGQTGIVG